MKFDLNLKNWFQDPSSKTFRQSFRTWQVLSNDILRSKIGHVREKLLKVNILLVCYDRELPPIVKYLL